MSGEGYAGTTTLTIIDNDAPAVTLGADVRVGEADGTFTVMATLDREVLGGFTVDVLTTGTGDPATAGSDYTVSPQTLTFGGEAGETETFTVTVVNDSEVETDETFTLSLGNLAGTSETVTISGGTARVTIIDDEVPAVTLGADVAVGEDGGTIMVTATLDGAIVLGFTVEASTGGGTATAGSDYTAVSGQTLTFRGEAGEPQIFSVTITDDMVAEVAETFTVSLDTLVLLAPGSTDMVTITDTVTVMITDNDDATVTLSPAAATVDEDVSSGTVTLTATLDIAVQGGFTVDVSTIAGTGAGGATAGEDYTAVTTPPDADFRRQHVGDADCHGGHHGRQRCRAE